MTGKPSLKFVPDNTYGRPRHPMKMPGYWMDRIGLLLVGGSVCIIALAVALGFMTVAFVAAKYQELPPIQGAIQLPNGVILNQALLHDKDAVDAAYRAMIRQHIYRWRSVTNGLTVEQQWKGMEFRIGGDAYDRLVSEMKKDPAKQPGTVLAQGLVRCTDVPDEIAVVPSSNREGWYEAKWYEVMIRAGAPCPASVLRRGENLRWGEFYLEIDPKPSATKKLWNLMGITIMDYKSDVVD